MPPQKYVSLADIAQRAGVSKNTVSKALRNSPKVSSERKTLIRQIADELGYRADPAVAACMSEVRKVRIPAAPANLAVILARLPDRRSWVGPYAEGIVTEAKRLKYGIERYQLKEWSSGKELGRLLSATGVKGVFLCAYTPRPPNFKLPWEEFSWIVSGKCEGLPTFTRVAPDCHQGMKLLMDELTRRGYRRIGLVARQSATRWIEAYLGRVRIEPSLHIPPLITEDPDENTLVRWLQTEAPDVVISLYEDVLCWIRTSGIRVPEDVGFAYISLGASAYRSSRLQVDFYRAGIVAMMAMDSQLRHNQIGVPEWPIVHSMPGQWIEGETIRSSQSEDVNG